ncbi:hypothetical protein [Dyadobacter sp. NIV53]|nr:hypothetical protein [Dyadobacter sp. NIV53]
MRKREDGGKGGIYIRGPADSQITQPYHGSVTKTIREKLKAKR